MNKFRSMLYRIAAILGDVQAVRSGRIVQRIIRKKAYKTGLSWINKFFR
jgi:hypothetical protein